MAERRQHLVAARRVHQQQRVVRDHDVRRRCLRARPLQEAAALAHERAAPREAVVRVGRQAAPVRPILAAHVQLPDVARLGLLEPDCHPRQQPRLLDAASPLRFQCLRPAFAAEIVRTSLQQRRPQRARRSARGALDKRRRCRQIALRELLLQVERLRGDDDALAAAQRVRERWHEVGERLPGPRPRLDREVPVVRDVRRHRPRHRELPRARLEAGQQIGPPPRLREQPLDSVLAQRRVLLDRAQRRRQRGGRPRARPEPRLGTSMQRRRWLGEPVAAAPRERLVEQRAKRPARLLGEPCEVPQRCELQLIEPFPQP